MSGMGVTSGGSSPGILNATGVDFSKDTQAMDFLGQMLNDRYFQVVGNEYARYFWYGILVAIGVAAVYNAVWRRTLQTRWASQ